MYGDFRQKSRGSQKRQREEENDERGNQSGLVDPFPRVDLPFAPVTGVHHAKDESRGTKQ